MTRRLVLVSLVASAACSSTPDRSPPGVGDRTDDPEFAAARERVEREYETQAEALEAGVYERFLPPDSIAPAAATPAPAARPARVRRRPEDPSTEELLGTLPAGSPYNRRAGVARPEPSRQVEGDLWSLQMGAFSSESGALVRLHQLEVDFPDVPGWHVSNGVVRVYLGRFADRDAAQRLLDRARARGYDDAWVTRAR